MRASQPQRAFTEDFWQKASSFLTGLSASTGLLTCPGRSAPPAVQHWGSQRLNETCWAGGLKTSQTPYVRLQRTLVQKLQLLVVVMMSAQSVVVNRVCARTPNHSWRREASGLERRWRSSSARSTDQSLRNLQFRRTRTETLSVQVQLDALEEEMVELGPLQDEEVDVPSRKQPGRQACREHQKSLERKR